MPAQKKKVTTVSLRERKGQGDKIVAVTPMTWPLPVWLTGPCGHCVGGRQSGHGGARLLEHPAGHPRRNGVPQSRRGPRRVVGPPVVDMPFMSYQASVEDGMRSAGRLLKEGGAER